MFKLNETEKALLKEYKELLNNNVRPNKKLLFYAFGKDQYEKGLSEYLNRFPELTEDDIFYYDYGIYASRENVRKFNQECKEIDQKRIDLLNKYDGLLYYCFKRELSNKEFIYCFDPDDTLNEVTDSTLNKKLSELNKREMKLLNRAKKDYLNTVIY